MRSSPIPPEIDSRLRGTSLAQRRCAPAGALAGRVTGGALTIVLAWTAGLPVAAAGQPDSVESLRTRAFALAYSHEHEEAAALLRRALTLAPDSSATSFTPARPRRSSV